jgi:hypothetical protein
MSTYAPSSRKRCRPSSGTPAIVSQQPALEPTPQYPTKRPRSSTRNQLSSPPKVQHTGSGTRSSEANVETTPRNTSGRVTATAWENQEFCHSCGDGGDLICCDFCVRSHHGVCLDLDIYQLPDPWRCPQCSLLGQDLDAARNEQASPQLDHGSSVSLTEALPLADLPEDSQALPNVDNTSDEGYDHVAVNATPHSRNASSVCIRALNAIGDVASVSTSEELTQDPNWLHDHTSFSDRSVSPTSAWQTDTLRPGSEPTCSNTTNVPTNNLERHRSWSRTNVQVSSGKNSSSQGQQCDNNRSLGEVDAGIAVLAEHLRQRQDEEQTLEQTLGDTNEPTVSTGCINHSGFLTPLSSACPEPCEALQSPRNAGRVIQDLLEDGKFKHCSLESLEKADLYTLNTVPEAVGDAWRRSTTRPPVIVSAKGCFTSAEPSSERLWQASFGTKGSKVFVNGEENTNRDNFALAFRQLFEPNLHCPITVIGIQPTKSALPSEYLVPGSLATYVTAHNQRDIVYNLTPKYSFVDLHIDYGADGISKTLGDCEKYWFLFPPTAYNLNLLASVHGDHGKLSKLLQTLEYGIITRTKASEALYIPSGCIHATYTTTGGFLVAKDFVTTHTFGAIVSLMRSEYFKVFDSQSRELCLKWFMTSIEVALEYRRFSNVFESWVAAESVLRTLARKDQAWIYRRARNCFEDALSEISEGVARCPCGWKQMQGTFKTHWRKTHLEHREP